MLISPWVHETSSASAQGLFNWNQRLSGQLLKFTRNLGHDNRIWSNALGERRDLLVYLPPGYDAKQCYPVMFWLHGMLEDEKGILQDNILTDYDRAMACGQLPPMIIAIPDGTLRGRPALLSPNTLWLNSKLGKFEDFVIEDVWGFVAQNFPIRPERQAHIVGGYSGGGMAAFRLGIKYRDHFGVVFGIHPPLNVRWLDCHGRYFRPFDPCCWGWRTDVKGREPVGRFFGVFVVRIRYLVYPLFGRGAGSMEEISRENPIEMIDLYQLREGDLAMYVAYAGRDQFNITAQVDSFLYRARERGLTVSSNFDPRGRHNVRTADRLRPGLFQWLNERIAPYSPSYQPPLVFQKHLEE